MRISEKITIGFATVHKESIYDERVSNFTRFSEFLKSAYCDVENINDALSERILKRYDAVIIGDPNEKFTKDECRHLKEYISNGGRVFILCKYGGDRISKTNISDLLKDVQPTDDELLSENCFLDMADSFNISRPLVDIKVNDHFLSFSGTICYDGGCTFLVKDNNSTTISPRNSIDDDNCFSYVNPRNGPPRRGDYINSRSSPGALGVFKPYGQGLVIYWGSRWSFSDEIFNYYDNSLLFSKLISMLIGKKGFNSELDRRMKQPQRHRLLHGYPMTTGMNVIDGPPNELFHALPRETDKNLCIGVIPHPLCNPQVSHCGYCTFPFEWYKPEKEISSIATVCAEIRSLTEKKKHLMGNAVSSLYFGGGTANLSSPENFNVLCKTIKDTFHLKHGAEITLEGAPSYFLEKRELLHIMQDTFPDAVNRISIGIQTFDEELLNSMGRSRMNASGIVEEAIHLARDMGFHVSGDFLFNLPNQSYGQIQQDLNNISDLGVEHICWYNLVAFPGLKAPWGNDPSILRSLPNEQQRLNNWLRLYEDLLDGGYEPVTVTDFRLRNSGERGRYQYEEDLRRPEKNNWVGFGSYATSMITNDDFTKGIKLMNPSSLIEYIQRQWEYHIPWNQFFSYAKEDLQLYWITRQIKGTSILKREFNQLFNKDIDEEYSFAFEQLCHKGLLDDHTDRFSLTPTGFYYADSIAGLFAWLRVAELSARKKSAIVSKLIHRKRQIINLPGEDNNLNQNEDWNDPRDMYMG